MAGEIIGQGPSYPVNARIQGDVLYLRDGNGNQIQGRSVSDGDEVTILDVGYSKQLVLLQYPTSSGWRQGYVKNVTSIIKYLNPKNWLNGTTPETVYDENGNKLGTLNPHEEATVLYEKNGKYHVVYDTDKGVNTKSGYVNFKGISNGGGNSQPEEKVIIGVVYNVTSSLNVREEASTSSSVIGSVAPNQTVEIVDDSIEGWYKIKYNDGYGFVSSKYIKTGGLNEEVTNGLVSKPLVDFVKTYESFRSRRYLDEGGVPTIGYGSTHGWIMQYTEVTEEMAARALMEEINSMASQIKRDLDRRSVVLKQCEFDSFASFAYNCGVDGLIRQSNLYERVCAGVRDSSLKQNFLSWIKVNGKVSQGLVNRRNDEYEMFMFGDYVRNH